VPGSSDRMSWMNWSGVNTALWSGDLTVWRDDLASSSLRRHRKLYFLGEPEM